MTSGETNGLYLFTNDLRLHDNPSLTHAFNTVDRLYCIYIIDSKLTKLNNINRHRYHFLWQSLSCLENQFKSMGHKLNIIYGSAILSLEKLLTANNFTHVFSNRSNESSEQECWRILQKFHPNVCFEQTDTHSLFALDDLPFDVRDTPKTYFEFKESVKDCVWQRPILKISELGNQVKSLQGCSANNAEIPLQFNSTSSAFQGGEIVALHELKNYFKSNKPKKGKEKYCFLDNWKNTSQFSPWVANGSLSVRKVLKTIQFHEHKNGQTSLTKEIYDQILRREYFQLLALKKKLNTVQHNDIEKLAVSNNTDYQTFKQWCDGKTACPIVNNHINELNMTGHLSNRKQKLVANYLINDLKHDWRFGAAYFEQVLIDYDIALNSGNWKFLSESENKKIKTYPMHSLNTDIKQSFSATASISIEQLQVQTQD